MKSKFLTLNYKDLLKGLIMAILGAVITSVYEIIQTGTIEGINLKQVGMVALIAAVTYLFKNLVSNSEGEFGAAEKKEQW